MKNKMSMKSDKSKEKYEDKSDKGGKGKAMETKGRIKAKGKKKDCK